MLTDPQTVTVNTVAKTLANVGAVNNATTYRTQDGEFTLFISHQATGKQRVRTLVKLTQRKVVTDPLSQVNDYDTMTINFTIDRPEYGWDAAGIDYVVAGLKTWLSTATITKLFGQEH